MITGKEFNEKYPTDEVVKMAVSDNIHNGFEYKDGINCLSKDEPFNSTAVEGYIAV